VLSLAEAQAHRPDCSITLTVLERSRREQSRRKGCPYILHSYDFSSGIKPDATVFTFPSSVFHPLFYSFVIRNQSSVIFSLEPLNPFSFLSSLNELSCLVYKTPFIADSHTSQPLGEDPGKIKLGTNYHLPLFIDIAPLPVN